MTNIKFPETNVVACVFSYRQNRVSGATVYDEYDHVEPAYMKDLKRYYYRVPESLQGKLKVGDAVLVHCQTGYQVCEIAEINVLMTSFDEKSMAPVVCKVDLQGYISEIEHKKKLVAMKKAIDAEKKRLESMVTYELIAEKNPEFKEMLEAFKAMGGEF